MNLTYFRPSVLMAACAVVGALSAMSTLAAAQTVGAAQSKKPAPAGASLDAELRAAIAGAPSAAQWPNSNYARLLDIGNVTVKSDGTVIARYRLTYKLFNERARVLAEVNLPYNASYQDIHVLSARTIRKNGSVVDVKPADIRVSSPYHEYLMYDDAQGIGFSMPAIEDECIIDYTWEEVTRPLLMPGQFWTYWNFSGTEPVGLCRYVLKAPIGKQINYKVYNDESLKPVVTQSVDGKFRTYTWERSNLKPIEFEPGMPPLSEIGSWLEVSSIGTWQEVARWFSGLQSPQVRSTPAVKRTVEELIAGKSTDTDKARAIYDWVANRTRYVGLEFGLSAYRPHPAPEVHDKQYGDCKDKANLLITMLQIAGIKARPVLLHAEERRPVNEGLPSLNAFNHCIAVATVDGREVWLDATAEACAFGDIPFSDRGVQGLVVDAGTGEFKTIPRYQPEENGVTIRSVVSLQADGSAEATYDIAMRGESGQRIRETLRAMTPAQRKDMMEKMAQRFATGGSMKSFSAPDGIDKTGTLKFQLVTTAPSYAEQADDLLIVSLLLPSNTPQASPYTADKREWPIVEEDASQTETETTITLPAGYTADRLPADLRLSSALQDYSRSITRSADGRSITIKSSVTEKPGRVAPQQYQTIRDYYNTLVKSGAQKIVLKKGA